MSMAFETTEFGRKNIKAAIHPADYTIRPQTVKREDNKSYYDLIKSFKNITKVGALLNTSLNLHGMPIALNHVDALYILFNSDLDAMVFDKIIVMKKKLQFLYFTLCLILKFVNFSDLSLHRKIIDFLKYFTVPGIIFFENFSDQFYFFYQ